MLGVRGPSFSLLNFVSFAPLRLKSGYERYGTTRAKPGGVERGGEPVRAGGRGRCRVFAWRREKFCAPGFAYLHDLDQWCKRAIHLQCAGGRDTLSLWNLGAHEVVGVDISERMIAIALAKTERLNAPAAWYHADVLEAPHELDGTADLVYTGRGALCWLMDMDAWAGVFHQAVLAPHEPPRGGPLLQTKGVGVNDERAGFAVWLGLSVVWLGGCRFVCALRGRHPLTPGEAPTLRWIGCLRNAKCPCFTRCRVKQGHFAFA